MGAVFLGCLDESIIGYVFRRIGGHGQNVRAHLPRGGEGSSRLVDESYPPEEPEGDVRPPPPPTAFYTRHPGMLRRAQVVIDAGVQPVVCAFNRGRARNRETHAPLVHLFERQVEYCFRLSLKWIPTAENGVPDAIPRPSREAHIFIVPAAFKVFRTEAGSSNMEPMARAASVLRSPLSGEALHLSFFTCCHMHCFQLFHVLRVPFP